MFVCCSPLQWSTIFPTEQVTEQQSALFVKKLLAVAVSSNPTCALQCGDFTSHFPLSSCSNTHTHTHTQPTDFQYHLLEVCSFSQLHNICLECPCYFLIRTIFPEHAFGDRCLEGQCSYSIIGVINSYPDPFLLLSLPPLSSPPPSPPSLPSLSLHLPQISI